MLSLFLCGSCSFPHQEEEKEKENNIAASLPTKKSKKGNKNPYSTRGLDKFSDLLTDLEEKRQKIYSQLGDEGISIVRFVYSNSNDCVPIVVKLKKVRKEDKDKQRVSVTQTNSEAADEIGQAPVALKEVEQPKLELSNEKTENKRKRFSWNVKLDKWKRPSYYLPVIIILILLSLAVYGRPFAVICTSIGWYVFPTLKDSSSTKNPAPKKNYVRRFSENLNYKRANENMKDYKKTYSGSLETTQIHRIRRKSL
ncbi:uncharacterized protein LOC112035100 [Quercus suber]|uniref:uncharacterized protein LOC112035100 n=1 Tax=Quercus suber TaxID=58331 RepID=UPI000CE255D8|nr:uncharacterized protein LOC112035100 [Quercus suber]POE96609.1 hypothetical protein CFP56_68936 [Quercus suber]